MKGILEFNLDDADDSIAHNRCVKALDLTLCINDILNSIRRHNKNDTTITHEEIREIIDDYNINMDDLIC